MWTQVLSNHDYDGVMEVAYCAHWPDPDAFLSMFTSNSPLNDPGWRNEVYDGMLASANAEADRAVRMQKLADCEAHLPGPRIDPGSTRAGLSSAEER